MESLLQDNGFVAIIIFFFVCFLQPIILPIPEVVTVTAGSAVFGSFVAACISFVGTLTGIVTMYFIARKGGRMVIRKFVKERHVQKYERCVSKNEIGLLLLMFIIPILPDEIICVGAGIGGVGVKKFIIIATVAKLITSFSLAYSLDVAQTLPFTNAQLIILLVLIVGMGMIISFVSDKLLLKRSGVKTNG